MSEKESIREKMLELTKSRGAGSSICPSEVARALFEEWRPHMDLVRKVAVEEARRGRVKITQKGQEISPEMIKGPIRLSWMEPDTP